MKNSGTGFMDRLVASLGFLPKLSASIKTVIFLCAFAVATPLYAIDSQTVTTLTDQNLVLSGPMELHITSASTAFSNATVSLNHEDAWVFFDNMKPSVVAASHLGGVLINGSAVNLGVNARIAIYAHGTVIMPHGAAFNPLTVYTEPSFAGNSQQHTIHTYYNTLGAFDNAIKSFKLKRGYMATFATQATGKGYSRVFIADDADLEVSVMPNQLIGTTSFIRVFKHEWVTKKGWCGTGSGAVTSADQTNSTWFYTWSADNASTRNLEYALIRQNAGWPGWGEINGKTNVSQLLGFNEPDHTEQSNITVDEAIAMWPDFMSSGLRLGAPATTNFGWLYSFMDKCKALNYRVDYVAVHAYWGGKTPQNWYNDLKYIHDRTGCALWITEWNNGANWTTEWWPDDPASLTTANATKQLNDIKAILNVLDTAHFVERYSIYNWVEDARAMILNSALTPAGEYYAANKSKIAFKRINEVIPSWTFLAPELAYTHYYTTTLNQIKLAWTDANGELSKGYKVERRINTDAYETIYESSDVSVLTYSDNIQSTVSGRITYKVSVLTPSGTYMTSNEVSYYQGSGAENVQAGNLLVSNSDWALCVFSQKYALTPLVYLGVQSLNNYVPLTNRVRTITSRSFYFHVDPWAYLNSPTLSSTDKMAFMALPKGVYDFGGLKAESGTLSGVMKDWLPITFTQTFTTPPAVFCTQTTSTTTFPTTVAVRNVTTTGFEVCLMKEEALATTFPGDKINFFAIESGSGVMGGRRITVGQTDGNVVGNTYSPVTLDVDPTYTQPVLFAGMLTTSDACASNLRYYSGGTNKINVVKIREASSSTTTVQKEKVGWMIMDLASDQPVGLGKSIRGNIIKCYPNPVSNILYLTIEQPTNVEVFDMYGRKYLHTVVTSGLDVSMLPFGTYVLKMEGAQPIRFMKK